jgi:hypothetical protein
MMTFDSFFATGREIAFDDFMESELAQQACIDRSWWPTVAPVGFILFDGHCWIAKFADGGFYTVIESQEYFDTLENLARKVYEWDREELRV